MTKITRDAVKVLALSRGFKLEVQHTDGTFDIESHVYDFAKDIVEVVCVLAAAQMANDFTKTTANNVGIQKIPEGYGWCEEQGRFLKHHPEHGWAQGVTREFAVKWSSLRHRFPQVKFGQETIKFPPDGSAHWAIKPVDRPLQGGIQEAGAPEPIPAGWGYDLDTGDFLEPDGQGFWSKKATNQFYDKWYFRRHEFPKVKYQTNVFG